MKKLFLASSLSQVPNRFQEFIGRDLKDQKALFITTAAEVETNTSFVGWTRDYFRRVGVEMSEFTVTGKTVDEIRIAIDDCDFVYLEGGNTYYLLQQLLLTGADEVFTKALEAGKIFVTTSAGSIVCGPDISPIGALDDPKQAPKLTSTVGLRWTKKVILPHHGPERVDGVKKIQAEFGKMFELQILTDKQAIAIIGEQETFVEEK